MIGKKVMLGFTSIYTHRKSDTLPVQIAFPQAILNIPQPGWQQSGNQSQSCSGAEGFLTKPRLTSPVLWIFGIIITIFMIYGGGGSGSGGGGGGGGG
jgi:hypothetical protein